MEDLHCSLGDRHSYTDPVTNRVMISGVSLDRDLAGMLMLGKYPQRLLPTFLHEMVHHWCFHSPVGSVLSYLQLRARRNSLLLLVESNHDSSDVEQSFDILLDLLRYEAAINLMRPLAEGMALFAEFDAEPGESAAISTPLSFTYLSFHEIEPSKAPFEGLSALLARHRLSDDMRERKANLLVQPFSCVGGGYLPGYMLVKNLWLYMLRERKCHRFWDRDLFLSYLQSFFYNDYEFIATLLSPETSEYIGLRITLADITEEEFRVLRIRPFIQETLFEQLHLNPCFELAKCFIYRYTTHFCPKVRVKIPLVCYVQEGLDRTQSAHVKPDEPSDESIF